MSNHGENIYWLSRFFLYFFKNYNVHKTSLCGIHFTIIRLSGISNGTSISSFHNIRCSNFDRANKTILILSNPINFHFTFVPNDTMITPFFAPSRNARISCEIMVNILINNCNVLCYSSNIE